MLKTIRKKKLILVSRKKKLTHRRKEKLILVSNNISLFGVCAMFFAFRIQQENLCFFLCFSRDTFSYPKQYTKSFGHLYNALRVFALLRYWIRNALRNSCLKQFHVNFMFLSFSPHEFVLSYPEFYLSNNMCLVIIIKVLHDYALF